MCLTPLHIGNPSRRFVRGKSRPILPVRCNHCAECIKQTQDDWFVRSVFEAKRVQNAGGAVWVPILTYRNEDLPRWIDEKYDIDIPCFDKSHFVSFRNKLRVYLSRDLYLRKGKLISRRRGSRPIPGDERIWKGRSDIKDANTIRYIYCCEYGEERGRSHIHALIFVPFYIPAKVMRHVIDKCWTYGYVRYSKDYGMIAQGMSAAQYSTKYIVKDMLWMKRYNIDAYLTQLKDDVRNAQTDKARLAAKEHLNAFRRVMPHHCQSMGFGIDGVEYFKNPDGTWNVDALVDGRFDRSKMGLPPTKKGQNYKYNMPMYFVRKIFYNPDEWNLYVMNELGKDIFALRFDLSLRRAAERLSPYVSSISTFREHIACLEPSNDDVVSGWEKINSLMHGCDASDLALFDKVYCDIEGTPDNECLISHMTSDMSDKDCIGILRDNALDFMLDCKSIDMEPRPEGVHYAKANMALGPVTFNDLPCFRGFRDVLRLIDDYELKIGKFRHAAFEFEREQEQKLKRFIPDPYILSNQMFFDYEGKE